MLHSQAAPSRPNFRNSLLRAMPPDVLNALWKHLELVPLTPKTVLLEADRSIHHVYFPESGTVSMIGTLEGGEQVEVGLVGREGMVGITVVLGSDTALLEALVQLCGHAWRIGSAELRRAIGREPAVMRPMLRYIEAFLFQVSQTAICNAHHQLEQRLARWLLMTHDRAETDTFMMTQEFLSHMLAVRRPTVTLVVGALQRAGLIRSGAGIVTVLDRAGLEAASCECYRTVRKRFDADGQRTAA